MLSVLSELSLPTNVRYAVNEDVKEMAAIGKIFYDATILPGYADYDEESMQGTMRELMERDDGVVLCLLKEGEIIGGIGGYIHPLYFNHNQLAAQQVYWFVLPEHRSRKSLRLLDAWESWAASQGAKVVWSGAKIDNNYDGMKSMMEWRKYVPLEAVFIKEV